MTATISGSSGVTFPAGGTGNTAGTVVGTTDTQTLTNKTLTSPTITGAAVSSMASSVITAGTAVASTSGTSIDFTSIPSWAKQITVMFAATSTNGASAKQIQLIYGGSTVVSTGYRSSSFRINDTTITELDITTGFFIRSESASDDMYGSYTINNLTGNTWVGTGAVTSVTGSIYSCGGVTISGTLTGVRITTINGTDAFDAGSINILYQ